MSAASSIDDIGSDKNLTAYDKKRIENAKKGIYMNPDRALSNGEPLEERFRGLIVKDPEDEKVKDKSEGKDTGSSKDKGKNDMGKKGKTLLAE